MRYIKYIIFALGIFLISTDGNCQNNKAPEKTEDLSDSKREEIQRYFGYEDLLVRYLTTPYDIPMTINERGNFLDIGFILLLLLPLMILLYFEKYKIFGVSFMIFLILMLISSTSNSFIFDSQNSRIIDNRDGIMKGKPSMDFTKAPIGFLVSKLYTVNNTLYKPVKSFAKKISGKSDYVTYPFIFSLLFALCAFLLKVFEKNKIRYRHKLAIILLLYSFLWFILSSGIVWYGFFMFLVGVVFIVLLKNRLQEGPSFNKFFKHAFYSCASIWIVMTFFNRVSNINPSASLEMQGLGVYNPSLFKYSQGLFDNNATIESLYPNLSPALTQRINKERTSLVYRVGTSFTYFIENNSERVFLDNQLGFFNSLIKRYPDRNMLTDVLIASRFKYIIVDLYTETIDRTPEKTLAKKYKLFMNFLYKNKKAKLIGTDRVIKLNDKNEYGVYGDIISNGTYAIFELIDN